VQNGNRLWKVLEGEKMNVDEFRRSLSAPHARSVLRAGRLVFIKVELSRDLGKHDYLNCIKLKCSTKTFCKEPWTVNSFRSMRPPSPSIVEASLVVLSTTEQKAVDASARAQYAPPFP
jgi:hypothetical protein